MPQEAGRANLAPRHAVAWAVRYVAPHRWPVMLLIAGVGALATAIILEPVGLLTTRFGNLPPQIPVVIFVNLIYPACIVAAAVYYPRARWVPVITLLAIASFTLGRALVRNWHVWEWRLPFVGEVLHPIVVVGGIVAGIFAAIATVVAQRFRTVGLPDAHNRCAACGYLLQGLGAGPCPECGVRAGDPAAPGA